MAYEYRPAVVGNAKAGYGLSWQRKTAAQWRRKMKKENRVRVEVVKPCPFCNEKPLIRMPGNMMWVIGCNTINCFCNVGLNPTYRTKEEAIEAWNKRLGEAGGNNSPQDVNLA